MSCVLAGLLVLSAVWGPSPSLAQEPAAAQPSVAASSETAAPALFKGLPQIGTVTLVVHDVFDNSLPAESNWLFRRANEFHVNTKESVIRRELLFREGEVYHPALLSETERNLRKLPLFRKASISASPPKDGKVDVTIETWDNWTFEPNASYKRAGGLQSWKVGLRDSNLLGYGKTAGVGYGENFSQVEKRVFYDDPQFLGRRLTLNTGIFEDGESRTYYASVAKPFYASIAQESLGLAASYRDEKVYHEFAVVDDGRVRQKTTEGSVFYGRSLGSSPAVVRRAIFRAGHSRSSLEAIPGESVLSGPGVDSLTTLDASFASEQQAFIKEQNIKKLYRDEDFNLGWVLSMGMAGSPEWLGSSYNTIEERVTAFKGLSLGPGHFGRGQVGMRSKLSGRDATSISWNFGLEYYRRLGSWNTLAAHASYDYGYRLNPPNAFRLGEEDGLRGYGLGQFAGNRRILVNLEDRVFVANDVLRLFSVGGVLFFDAGGAWKDGEDIGVRSARSAVGAGLRFGSTRGGAGSPLRIDLAYAFNENNQASPWSLSILAGQAF
ncbi:MAG: BamA/TamA family outer membrane protein [Elusimicrobia bacterium]|nr:BamA/TamA family outer membrane protein [Elusimicrobiota bacterium]